LLRPRNAIVVALSLLTGCEHHHSPVTPSTAAPGTTITKALWVANLTSVVEFLPSQLTAGGDQTPTLVNASSVFGSVEGIAFDTSGNMWVIDAGDLSSQGTARPAIYEFSASQVAQLSSNQEPTPVLTINYTGFTTPVQGRFDAGGDLWVTDSGSNAVFEYTAAQLAAGGFTVTPNVRLTATPAFSSPVGISFSPTGNLWIANNGTSTLEEFNVTALPTAFGSNVTLTPNVILGNNGSSLAAPFGLAFDPSGNLWAANTNTPDALVRFVPSNLAASGDPAPFVITSATEGGNGTLVAPNGIAFDNLGDLVAVSSGSPFGIPFYAASQLKSGGTVVPQEFLVGPNTTLNEPAGVAFGPIVN